MSLKRFSALTASILALFTLTTFRQADPDANSAARQLASPVYKNDSSELRAKIVPLTEQNPGNYLVVLGADRSRIPGGFFTTNNQALGISGNDLNQFEPMYLFFANELGIHQVYTFRLGRFTRNVSMSPKGRQQDPEQADREAHPENYPGLPSSLLDVQHPVRDRNLSWAIKGVLELIKLTPASIGIKPFQTLLTEADHPIHSEMMLFQELLTTGIQSGALSELGGILSPEAIDQLKTAIDIRTGTQSGLGAMGPWEGKTWHERVTQIAAVFKGANDNNKQIMKKNEADQARTDAAKEQVAQAYAEQMGLVYIPFGARSGMFAVDLGFSLKYPDLVYSLAGGQDTVEHALTRYQNKEGSRFFGLVAIALPEQALVRKKDPKTGIEDDSLFFRQTISLNHTSDQLRNQKGLNFFKMLRGIGYGFIPGPFDLVPSYTEHGLSLVADASEAAIAYVEVKYKNRFTRFLKRVFSYNFIETSDLIGAAELGVLVPDPNDRGLFFASFMEYLENQAIKEKNQDSAKALSSYREKFLSSNPQDYEDAAKALMLLYLNSIENHQYLLQSRTAEETLDTERTYTDRLSHWLEDRHWLECGYRMTCRQLQNALMNKRLRKAQKNAEKVAP